MYRNPETGQKEDYRDIATGFHEGYLADLALEVQYEPNGQAETDDISAPIPQTPNSAPPVLASGIHTRVQQQSPIQISRYLRASPVPCSDERPARSLIHLSCPPLLSAPFVRCQRPSEEGFHAENSYIDSCQDPFSDRVTLIQKIDRGATAHADHSFLASSFPYKSKRDHRPSETYSGVEAPIFGETLPSPSTIDTSNEDERSRNSPRASIEYEIWSQSSQSKMSRKFESGRESSPDRERQMTATKRPTRENRVGNHVAEDASNDDELLLPREATTGFRRTKLLPKTREAAQWSYQDTFTDVHKARDFISGVGWPAKMQHVSIGHGRDDDWRAMSDSRSRARCAKRVFESLTHDYRADPPELAGPENRRAHGYYIRGQQNSFADVQNKMSTIDECQMAEARCVDLVDRVINIHKHGILRRVFHKAGSRVGFRPQVGLVCSERMSEVIRVISENKLAAKDVLDGNIEGLINAPTSCLKRKTENVVNNARKAEAKGKTTKDSKGESAAKRQKTTDRAQNPKPPTQGKAKVELTTDHEESHHIEESSQEQWDSAQEVEDGKCEDEWHF